MIPWKTLALKCCRSSAPRSSATSPEERAAFLDTACGGNVELRRRIEALLRAHDEAGGFLQENPAGSDPVATIDQPTSEAPGTVIGPYKLLEQIGEGGFGVVFMAEQTQPVRRKIALKILKPGMDTRQVVARFEAERQALALMDHPNIAKVFDGGVTLSGRPYFVMELIKGAPITEYCDQNHLNPRQRLELFVPVCQAVQHAHQKGIIHRDLKPSNVLVSRHDSIAVVKVIDFGVAKALGQVLTDKSIFTAIAQMVGTPLYMSPEQAGMSDLDVDTRSDIYSLGVLLYELLTGTTPFNKERFKKAAYDEIRRIIREEEPPKPSTRLTDSKDSLPSIAVNRGLEPKKLSGLVRGELDWIVMKSLEKDRNRRYETANGLAADVMRYLADEAVLACPPSAGYRLRKFARRNKASLTIAGLILFFVVALGIGAGWVVRDREARRLEIAHERAARQAKAANQLELALERADLFQQQGKRPEAMAAFDRAQLLASEVDPDPARDEHLAAVKERLDIDARGQEFIARFEDIRLRAQGRVNMRENHFETVASFPEIREAFRQYGIDFGVMTPAEAAAFIRKSPALIRSNLVAAMDQCLTLAPRGDSQTLHWLFDTLNAADNDAWRARVRKAWVADNRKEVEQLAREADVRKQPLNSLLTVATYRPQEMRATQLELLRRIQHAYPGDLWANIQLGTALDMNGLAVEAIRYYTAALALRPDNPGIYLNRGRALRRRESWTRPSPTCANPLPLLPSTPRPTAHSASALRANHQLDKAIAEDREAIRINNDFAEAHYALGIDLKNNGLLDEAVTEFRKAIRIKPNLPCAHYNLAIGPSSQRPTGRSHRRIPRSHPLKAG